ncbi:MAG: ATP-dependent DNA helicase [Polyangiaceae bacterium]
MSRSLEWLGPGSALARATQNWERRDGQLAMAEAVERALDEEVSLFVEAGTGTGKTVAYLVPAVLSGRKVVVSTATRALEDQVFLKDLPLVAQALAASGIRFRAALMKGLPNYVCLRRLGELAASGESGADGTLTRLTSWAARSRTGDRAELAEMPEDSEIWRAVSSSSETRIGSECEHFEACFVTRMRREAADAQIVVVNHHLFMADLALRTGPRGATASVLPAYDAVIFDEAHQLEDIATEFFGVRVSTARLESLERDAGRSLAAIRPKESGAQGAHRVTFEGLREAGRAFFAAAAKADRTAPLGSVPSSPRATQSPDSRRVLPSPGADLLAAYQALDLRLEGLQAMAALRSEEASQAIARRAGELRDDLRFILRPPDGEAEEPGDIVRWVDVRSRSVSIGASPVDVGSTLRSRLFDRVPTVVCTSATLATAGSFHFAKSRLGAPPETQDLLVASPFDFACRALLYLPDDLPEPADSGFESAAADRIAELVRMTGGGAFVLCTSTRAMRSLHGLVRGRLAQPTLLQGEAPKHLLLERFRASGHSVLVATMSFWEGVDVPGWALRLVIIDRIPFAPPGDPVFAARCARIEHEGGSGFTQYSVPSAAMALKQGFGRLIRTQNDAGVVAVLDRRIVRRGYGRLLLASLPPARQVRELGVLRREWEELVKLAGPGATSGVAAGGE